MSTSNRPRLGRGLSSLITASQSVASVDHTASLRKLEKEDKDGPIATILPGIRVQEIEITLIDPNPDQPRESMDNISLQELADSIRANGILQPILIKPAGARYQLVAGHRRTEAAKIAGYTTIPALVRTDSKQESQLEWALIENIQRKDLNPIERAKAYKTYIDRFNFTHAQAAQRLGEDRTTISNFLRLLELSDDVRAMISSGEISAGHAKVLAGVEDRRRQSDLAGMVVDGDLSVRALERLTRQSPPADTAGAAETDVRSHTRLLKSPHILEMEQDLSRKLGTKVRIFPARRRNSGKIVIQYFTLDDFESIVERFS